MRIHNTIDRLDDQIFRTADGDTLTITQLKALMKKNFKYGNKLQIDEAQKESSTILSLYLKHIGLEDNDENQDKAWDECVSDHLTNYMDFLSEVDYRSAPLASSAIKACEFFELIGYGK